MFFFNSAAFSAVTFYDMSFASKLNAHFEKSSWRAEYLIRLFLFVHIQIEMLGTQFYLHNKVCSDFFLIEKAQDNTKL